MKYHILLLLLFNIPILPAQRSSAQEQDVRYEVVHLGECSASQPISPMAINDSGIIAGSCTVDHVPYAGIWDDGVWQFLESGTSSEARAINNDGEVAGWYYDSNWWMRPFMWNGANLQDTGILEPGNAMANGINNAGHIVGTSGVKAFIWQDGNIQDLGILEHHDESRGEAINDLGQIAGYTLIKPGSGTSFGSMFLWQNGNLFDLGVMQGFYSSHPKAINSNGDIVGDAADKHFRTGRSTMSRAFRWRNGIWINLGSLSGYNYSTAVSINESGHIVGTSYNIPNVAESPPQALLWGNSGMANLNRLIDPGSGWILNQATHINNSGMIVGVGTLNGVRAHGFLLIPKSNTITVNSTNDADDNDPDDGICDTGEEMPNGRAECTLRAAIRQANSLDEPVVINFDILQDGNTFLDGNPVIEPVSALPYLLNEITLDATTQPEGRVILSGASAGSQTDGLRANADNIIIQGLVISDFDGFGIALLEGNNHLVIGNIIGYDPDEAELRLNESGGIYIDSQTSGATVGTAATDELELMKTVAANKNDSYDVRNNKNGDYAALAENFTLSEQPNSIAGGISFDEIIPEGVRILSNRIEVPADWLSGDELRVPVGTGSGGSPACVPWHDNSSNRIPTPRILDLATGHVAGITRPGATVIIYEVLEAGSDRGRYFPRKVEAVASGVASQTGEFNISLSVSAGTMISAGAVGAEGGISELSQLKRPVIYSPGIGGSWLRGSNNDRLWLPLALGDSEKNNRLARLALNEFGEDLESVHVDGILEFSGLAGYGPALRNLQNNGYPGHPDNQNTVTLDLWRFANDWRKNPHDLADSLRSLVDFVVSENPSVARSCEVDIVSHSNGGVVASVYVRKYPEHSSINVNRMLTIGTPYLGTPQAAAAHTRGYIFGVEEILHFGVEWGRMVGMTRNLTGAYGLMPSKKYWQATNFNANPGYLMDLQGNTLSSYEETMDFITAPKTDANASPLGLNRNAPLWNQVETNVHGLIDDWRQWNGPPQVYRLVGNMQASTTVGWFWEPFPFPIQLFNAFENHRDPGDADAHLEYRTMQVAVPGDGDGTVSLSSATLGHHPGVGAVDFSGVGTSSWINGFEYYPCNHMELVEQSCGSTQNGMPIFDRVLEILRSSYTVNPSGVQKAPHLLAQNQIPKSDIQQSADVYDVFYISSSMPIGVHVFDDEGNHTGPSSLLSTAVSDSIVYGIPGIGYWPNTLAATVSLDRNKAYDLRIVAPVEAGRIRVARVLMDTSETNIQVVFPDLDVLAGGSIKMHLEQGGLSKDAAFQADINGSGSFGTLLEPALALSSNMAVPAVPSPERFIYTIELSQEDKLDQQDHGLEIRFRGSSGEGWEWDIAGHSDRIIPSAASGTLDQVPYITIPASTFPEDSWTDTLSLAVRKDLYKKEYPIIIRVNSDKPVNIEENGEMTTGEYQLGQNYPNPFNPSTVIGFDLPAGGEVRLEVYDMLGRRIATLVDGHREAGRHSATFDAANLASGIYIYHITTGQYTATRRMTLVK